MALESLLRNTVVGVLAKKLPNDKSLVAAAAQDEVGIARVGSDLRDPSIVSGEGTFQDEFLVRGRNGGSHSDCGSNKVRSSPL